ncbi:MAG: hypothetical protein KAQ85_00745 [Thermodesulfovibrionia bacterium]|nr:hypothetical protein [Thermodesulfovibrionia bacterium]
MGKDLFCDLCRKSVAIEDALKPIMIGGELVAEACLTCGSQITQSIKKTVAQAAANIAAAKAAPLQQPAKPVEEEKPQPPAQPEIKPVASGIPPKLPG